MAATLSMPTDTCGVPTPGGPDRVWRETGARYVSGPAVSVQIARPERKREERSRWHTAADPTAKALPRPGLANRWLSTATTARCAARDAATVSSACYSGYRKLCCRTNV